jgi:mRNA interferase MazF
MSQKSKYIPSKGDLIWLDFNPQAGREIMKRRPALVLSPQAYNKHGLILAVPITSKAKGYPFEVKINNDKIGGVALADAIKSLDWKERNAEFAGTASKEELLEVLKLLSVLLKV